MKRSHKKMMLSQQKVPKNLHNMCKRYSQKTKWHESGRSAKVMIEERNTTIIKRCLIPTKKVKNKQKKIVKEHKRDKQPQRSSKMTA